MLDAILSPEWEFRYYSFNAHWGDGEALGSMRNGQGDEYVCLFNGAGVILKGFCHEESNLRHVDIPPPFAESLANRAFETEWTTFLLWRTFNDPEWQISGSNTEETARLVRLLDNNPRTYQQWAEAYYECPISLHAVQHIYDHQPLTPSILSLLNSDVSLETLSDDIAEIGY